MKYSAVERQDKYRHLCHNIAQHFNHNESKDTMATIGRYYLSACSSAARKKNTDTKSLMSIAGIKSTTRENVAERINDASMTLFLNAIATETNDAFLGFSARPVPLSYFSQLLQSLYFCQTIEHAIANLTTSFSLVGCRLSIEPIQLENQTNNKAESISLSLTHNHQDPDNFLLEYLLVFIHRILSWLAGKKIELNFAQVTYRPKEYQKEFTLLFRCPVKFSQSKNGLVFEAKLLKLPVVKDRNAFLKLIKEFPMMVLHFPGEEHAMSHQVKLLLAKHFKKSQSILTATDVAEILNISSPTLRRKLAGLSTNFGELKADFVKSKAMTLLQKTNYTNEVIAEILGYSEARAFSRVFKSWTGMTPSQYRALFR